MTMKKPVSKVPAHKKSTKPVSKAKTPVKTTKVPVKKIKPSVKAKPTKPIAKKAVKPIAKTISSVKLLNLLPSRSRLYQN